VSAYERYDVARTPDGSMEGVASGAWPDRMEYQLVGWRWSSLLL